MRGLTYVCTRPLRGQCGTGLHGLAARGEGLHLVVSLLRHHPRDHVFSLLSACMLTCSGSGHGGGAVVLPDALATVAEQSTLEQVNLNEIETFECKYGGCSVAIL